MGRPVAPVRRFRAPHLLGGDGPPTCDRLADSESIFCSASSVRLLAGNCGRTTLRKPAFYQRNNRLLLARRNPTLGLGNYRSIQLSYGIRRYLPRPPIPLKRAIRQVRTAITLTLRLSRPIRTQLPRLRQHLLHRRILHVRRVTVLVQNAFDHHPDLGLGAVA
jgi:hypothetical protein